MDTIAIIILSIEGLLVLGAIVLLIVFTDKRLKARKNETFEDREN